MNRQTDVGKNNSLTNFTSSAQTVRRSVHDHDPLLRPLSASARDYELDCRHMFEQGVYALSYR